LDGKFQVINVEASEPERLCTYDLALFLMETDVKATTGFLLFITAIGPALVATASAAPGDGAEPIETASEQAAHYADVQEVFDTKCVSCHTGPEAVRGLSLDSWESTIAGSDHGEAVIAYDAARSLLIELTTKFVGGPHPIELDAEGLTDDEVEVLSTWINEGAPSASGEIPFADAEHLLYAANQSEAVVSVIDMETNQVVRTVDLQPLGLPANAWPHHIAVEPDGSYWYLSLIASNQILKFDRQNELVARIDFVRPGLLAVDPAGENLYAARSMAAVSPPQEIGVIRRSDMSFEEVGIFIPRPHALAVQPGTGTVFTASLSVNQIASFYPEDEALELADLGGDRPHTFIGFTTSPDGRWMVGTTELTASVFVFDLEQADMIPVDTIAVNAAPWHPTFTPDGRWVYVGNNWDNTATVIDMETREVAKVIEGNGLAQPHGAATSPDGRFAYIASRNLEMPPGHSKYEHMYTPRYDTGDNARAGTVVVIDTATQEIVKVIEIEGYGAGLGTAARLP
jgi:YVTN family beta-propeller protein